MCVPNGSRPSRAIANSSRMQEAITASVQTEMAIAESTRNTLPTVLPSACLMMYGRPSAEMFGSLMFFTAISANRISRPPMIEAAISARMIAGGAFRRGSLVSSASVPAVSNPYITYALMIPPMMNAPK